MRLPDCYSEKALSTMHTASAAGINTTNHSAKLGRRPTLPLPSGRKTLNTQTPPTNIPAAHKILIRNSGAESIAIIADDMRWYSERRKLKPDHCRAAGAAGDWRWWPGPAGGAGGLACLLRLWSIC